jgi:hypothetical protein
MSFRLLLWGDSSQNDNLAGIFTQQAESEFRNTYKSEFDELNPLTVQSNLQLPNDTVPENTIQTALSGTIDAVSELVQTISGNADNKGLQDKDLETVQTAPNNIGSDNTVSNFIQTIKSDNADQPSQIKAANELIESVSSVSDSIQKVSQSLNESSAAAPVNSNTSIREPQNEALKDMLNKMRDFLSEVKEKVLSFLKSFQQPQLEYYYGIEDKNKEFYKNQPNKAENAKRQEKLEEKLRQKTVEVEFDKQIKKKQTKLKTELLEQSIKKEEQSELENLLAKRMEEARKKSLFETNFLPK